MNLWIDDKQIKTVTIQGLRLLKLDFTKFYKDSGQMPHINMNILSDHTKEENEYRDMMRESIDNILSYLGGLQSGDN